MFNNTKLFCNLLKNGKDNVMFPINANNFIPISQNDDNVTEALSEWFNCLIYLLCGQIWFTC